MSTGSVVGSKNHRERLETIHSECPNPPRAVSWPGAKMTKLGFLGFGNIGSQIGIMAQSLGIKSILYHTRHPLPPTSDLDLDLRAKHVSLDDLYAGSDVIVITCPLTPETRGMVNDRAFGRMRDGIVLVNVARGAIVDDDALVRALKSGKGEQPFDTSLWCHLSRRCRTERGG